MKKMDITSISSKGQVVIPSLIRKSLGLNEGAKLMVMTDGRCLLLKPIESPSQETFDELIKASRLIAQSTKLTKKSLNAIIKRIRNESSH